ncbi:MAG: RpiB/LacA/LacB family sugar-phosphate isomerase [Clostridia bacterium]|nr:RpiB/LacA/LacB family sugar-phosphate isomerase [Clostridia bacterium]MBQ2737064.1 RpiB/LacA/LacB family sugar-phosphate isomerase [Clostridia bacterium]MBQ8289482.1 RpiB/LacA/LacB family sugar-phosphate isomerase [Clostridia bacterium]
MKIALINENSQAAKNELIEKTLRSVVEPLGHEVFNYGMYSAEDEAQLTYVQIGILSAILLNSGACDLVITGCGTGEGAMLACNSFPGVLCGHVVDPTDAYQFTQVNNGNAIAMPFAKGWGWGCELNLQYVFEKLFVSEWGLGYPRERAVPEQRNKKILDEVKKVTHTDIVYILENLDRELVLGAIAGKNFRKFFLENCKDERIKSCVLSLLGE